MNKDVIYIEADDDIADIISKIQNAKERIVALIPPQHSNILKNTVNIKLMTKSARSAQKTVVLVTVDPVLVKLSALAKIPVTKDLKTAPAIPTLDIPADDSSSSEVILEDSDKIVAEETTDEVPAEDTPKAPVKKSSKLASLKTKLAKTSAFKWVQHNRKWLLIGGGALLLLVIILIWALVIAPAVTISVTVKTTNNNFSETIRFTQKLEEEDSENGVFYLDEHKTESESKVEFNATGTKNAGDKATGSLVVYAYFSDEGSISIPSTTTFTYNDLTYRISENQTLSWDGTISACENDFVSISDSCLRTLTIKATAAEPGEAYNTAASDTGWSTSLSTIKASAKTDFTGGTDKIITVVSQSDIDRAKENLRSASENDNKVLLIEELSDDQLAIESSFKQVVSDPTPSVVIGEEVQNDNPVTLTSTTTATIFVIDLTKVKEFISEKAKVSDKDRIYALGSPFIENFFEAENGYTGKLKTAFTVGPNITETSILENIKGKLVGEVKGIIKDSGASNVEIDRSFPWVNVVPDNPNKITIDLIMEQ